jgi:hypothetical protein
MVPSESAPQEFPVNGYVSTILNILGNSVSPPPLVTEVTISPYELNGPNHAKQFIV